MIIEELSMPVYEYTLQCMACGNTYNAHMPYEFSDERVLYCMVDGNEKWVPIYHDDYGLTGFKKKFRDKFGIELKSNSEFESMFERYVENCACGGKYVFPTKETSIIRPCPMCHASNPKLIKEEIKQICIELISFNLER